MNSANQDTSIFRVVRYIVPASSDKEFLRNLAETDATFNGIEGRLKRYILKQQGTNGDHVYMTIGQWASMDAVNRAREAAAGRHARLQQTPQELFARLGIEAELLDCISIL
jgi:heme-degrading monooxygenase HmoA